MTDTLRGTVDRITYFNQENGCTRLQLQPDQAMVPGLSQEGLLTAIGSLPEVTPGEHLSGIRHHCKFTCLVKRNHRSFAMSSGTTGVGAWMDF